MEQWKKISLLLCIYGFFREFRPSEPFTVEFFIVNRNLTIDNITTSVFPLGTYSYMFSLIAVFLVTDAFRYKPIIVFSSLCGVTIFASFAWIETIAGIVIGQIAYGLFMASEIAYYTYIYAKVEKEHYQLVTGHTRSAFLVGRFLGSIIAQFLISFQLCNFHQLIIQSFATQCISIVWSLMLPPVIGSMYFHQAKPSSASDVTIVSVINMEKVENEIVELPMRKSDDEIETKKFSCSNAINLIVLHVRSSYSKFDVIIWSIWWTVAMCGFLQIQSYIQLLWKEIDPLEESVFNGAVEAAITLCGAAGAVVAGFMESKQFKRYEIFILILCTLCEAGLMLWSSVTTSLWSCYCAYVAFGTVYHFMITIASASVAKKIHDDCFALIFGINTLIALIFQSLLTYIVITSLNIHVRTQYAIYSGLFVVLAVICATIPAIKLWWNNRTSH